MEPFEFAIFGFDVILVLLGLYFAMQARKMSAAKGDFGTGARLFCWSLVFLGFVHMIETVLDIAGLSVEWNELAHRILVLGFFLMIIYGFMVMKKDIFIPPK
jgi:hypothetical protein